MARKGWTWHLLGHESGSAEMLAGRHEQAIGKSL